MEEIEERINAIANSLVESIAYKPNEYDLGIAKDALTMIATEQKAIDDKLLKRVHKGVLDKAIKEKKEAAMKAYCKRCVILCGGYPCSHKCYEYLEFEKTLEE